MRVVDSTQAEHEAVQADSVRLTLLEALEALPPAERVAFVLHDLFAVPFEEIGPIVGRFPAGARKLAIRARGRVWGADPAADDDGTRQRAVVDAFLAASRGGDSDALVALLDPDVRLLADGTAVLAGVAGEISGARAVAGAVAGRSRAARFALINGVAGAVWSGGGQPGVVVFDFSVAGGRIVEIELIADPAGLTELDLVSTGEPT
jgi:RNA polymerase sigma-70 factor (ECF subfamily)